MEKDYKNKAITGDEPGTKDKGFATPGEEFFFPGGGEYLPLTIVAANQAEALKVYETKKVKVNK